MNYKKLFTLRSISLCWLCCLLIATTCSAQITPLCVNPSQINPNIACPAVYAPVCGCNGITYGNSCEAYNWGGVTSWTSGPCTSGSCQADFNWNLGIVPPTVFFTDVSTGNPFSWSWDFGDGNSSNLQNPAHDYKYAGQYVVCLTITSFQFGGLFCIDTYCDTVDAPGCVDTSIIDPNAPCPAVIAPVCGCDGNTYVNSCVAQQYNGITIWTNGPCNNQCTADYDWDLSYAGLSNGANVVFTNQSTTNSIGSAVSYSWNFGDGNSSTQQNPTHFYSAPGRYKVCLTFSVLDFNGNALCSDIYCDTVAVPCTDTSLINNLVLCPPPNPVCGCDGNTYVNGCDARFFNGVVYWTPGQCPPPPCDAFFTYTVGIFGPDLFFFDQSTGNPTGWSWDFGDGTTSNLQNPVHRYDVTGNYVVCLTIFSPGPNACFDTYCDTIYATGCVNPSQIDSNAICPDIYDPVCGCNGETYINPCEAQNYGGVTIWTPGPCGYCPSFASNSNIGWIDRVGPNTSGNNGGYALFNFCNFTFTAGQTVQVPLFVGANNPPAGVVAHWRLWIDYNQDEDFDDAGEMVWQGLGAFPTAIFTIPNNVCSGCTRLRFQVSDLFRPACGPYTFGETEDYEVTMLGAGISCKNGSDVSAVEEQPFGQVVDNSINMKMFPNPAVNQVNIHLELVEIGESISVDVYDLSGKLMITQTFSNTTLDENLIISTGELSNGIYQVAVQTGDSYKNEKLIIAK